MTKAIASPGGRLAEARTAETDTFEIIGDLYLAAYARNPSEEESARLASFAADAEDRGAALEDIYWSVLNSKEFVFNH